MSLLRKGINYIMQDVENANETKRASVIMRMFALIMCAYFLVESVVMLCCGEFQCVIVCVCCLLGYCGIFRITYMNKTRVALRCTLYFTIVWIVAYVYLYGWDCGVQHFLFINLIIFFLVSYTTLWKKIGVAVALCALRYGLYSYTSAYEPQVVLSDAAYGVIQFVNTFTVFAIITVVLAYFCENSLAMEQKLVQYNAKLQEISKKDPLTKLYNRRAMKEYLEEQVENEQRYGTWLNIAIGDIDFFKLVNDEYGHEAGDVVLVEIAKTISDYMKGKGQASRWGGEEFLLLFKDINGEEAFMELEKLRSIIARQKITYNGQDISVTMTFGLEEYSNNLPMESTINDADKKLYMGKQQGRNRVIF